MCKKLTILCWAEAIASKSIMFDEEDSTWLSSTRESASATRLLVPLVKRMSSSKLRYKVQMTSLSRRRPFRLRTHRKSERLVVSI